MKKDIEYKFIFCKLNFSKYINLLNIKKKKNTQNNFIKKISIFDEQRLLC